MNGLYAVYQRIVDSEFRCFGYESLIRGRDTSYLISVLTSSDRKNESEILTLDMIGKNCAIESADFIFEAGQMLFLNSHPFSRLPYDADLLSDTAKKELIIAEITEHAPLSDRVLENLLAFQEKHGIKFALDDFGSGYINFGSVLALKPDYIKVSKETIKEAPTSVRQSSLIKNICNLCDSINARVIFEGVETERQFEFLRQTQPNALFQGFYIAIPQSRNEIIQPAQIRI